ncbi:Cysteine oxygenase/2-aminoethanethiol dioxygenase [Trypanosoma melophagium]|uniref:Cysteine oxygenase/2-aminoethanethiol dioxygenase n=1 Tax=Trypanosoma melophagium TaxID=715481 RepID=UPI00351AA07D|nr:Cysteine oxygenase/2-aminoethanethiol dioxygenase [Trypanosoma melophagium]
MLALKSALQPRGGRFCSAEIVRALAQLTLADLQSYVPESAWLSWAHHRRTPLAASAFSLNDALNTTGPDRWWGKLGDTLGCCTLYETSDVVVCWFVVPPGGMLPLHDHCTMTVWQRVLFGKLHVTSIDWVDRTSPEKVLLQEPHNVEGVVVFSDVVTAQLSSDDPFSLVSSFGPNSGGVLHEIVNKSDDPALFIDVITPPYNKPPRNINCTYYWATCAGDGGVGVVCNTLPQEQQNGNQTKNRFKVGQRVFLTPRRSYVGPPMDAFVPLQSLF